MMGLLEVLPNLDSAGLGLLKTKPGVIRRLVGIEDKEGKTRVIAIGDYWSQTALRRLHL